MIFSFLFYIFIFSVFEEIFSFFPTIPELQGALRAGLFTFSRGGLFGEPESPYDVPYTNSTGLMGNRKKSFLLTPSPDLVTGFLKSV
jgi:hypothetical protein